MVASCQTDLCRGANEIQMTEKHHWTNVQLKTLTSTLVENIWNTRKNSFASLLHLIKSGELLSNRPLVDWSHEILVEQKRPVQWYQIISLEQQNDYDKVSRVVSTDSWRTSCRKLCFNMTLHCPSESRPLCNLRFAGDIRLQRTPTTLQKFGENSYRIRNRNKLW